MGTTPDRQYGRELATEPEVDAKIVAHRDTTLLHDVDRAATKEIVRDANGRVQFVRFRVGAGGPMIRETEVVRDGSGRVASITVRQFEPPGTLARWKSLAFSRDGGGRVSGGAMTIG